MDEGDEANTTVGDDGEGIEDQFQFFSAFAKPLVLELPSADDKAVAAAWIERLQAPPENEEERKLRLEYIKLLVFVMQRGYLIGIFKEKPEEGKPLQPFPERYTIQEMGNYLLEEAERQGSGDAQESGISYSVDISNDLKEFVAAQEVPNFGVQCYYAWSSDDPVHKWTSFEEKKFPSHVQDKIKQLMAAEDNEGGPAQACLDNTERDRDCPGRSCPYERKLKVKSPKQIEMERIYEERCQKGQAKKSSAEMPVQMVEERNATSFKTLCDTLDWVTSDEGEDEEAGADSYESSPPGGMKICPAMARRMRSPGKSQRSKQPACKAAQRGEGLCSRKYPCGGGCNF